MSAGIRWAILGLALVGLGLSLWATQVHYRLITDPTYVSPCDVNASFSCTTAYQSRFGSVGRVPTALGGVVWFGLVALIAGFARPGSQPSAAAGYLFGVSIIGLAVVLYLAYASYFVLGTGCPLCIGTYVCVLGIFALSAMTRGVPMTQLIGRLPNDIAAALRRPAALLLSVVFVAGTGLAIALFPSEADAIVDRPVETVSGDVRANFAAAWEKQPRVDLGLPLDGAKVIVVKFNDFSCPSCRQYEAFYKPVFDKFAKSHPGAVRLVVKDWPWNAECNFNSQGTIPGHEAACESAAFARLAKDRGKYDEMVEWIYANQATSKAALREAATRILGPADWDKEYALRLPDIRKDIADGGALGVRSTPTYYVNGVLLPSGMQPEYFELGIQLELDKAK